MLVVRRDGPRLPVYVMRHTKHCPDHEKCLISTFSTPWPREYIPSVWYSHVSHLADFEVRKLR